MASKTNKGTAAALRRIGKDGRAVVALSMLVQAETRAAKTREQLEIEERAWEHTETDRSPWGEFTIADLRVAFDAVAPADNWKNPICATVPAAALAITCAAIVFFTGSVPTVRSAAAVGSMEVRAAGYYAACGA